jgi:ribosomal protein L16 Arg81 hydroxylase
MKSFPGIKPVPVEDRSLFNLLFLLEHYFPKSERIKETKDSARERVVAELKRRGKGQVIPVERVSSLTPQEFQERYLSKGIPVIIENAARSWPCVKQWSFDAFQQRYGQEKIKIVQRKGLSDDDWIDEKEFSEEVVFGDFLRGVLAGGQKYMRFSPLLEKFPELLKDFDGEFFKSMTGNNLGVTFQLFIGGQGTYTPLHNAMTPFFFVNICGVKRWSLIPNQFMAVLNPGADGFGYNHSGAEGNLTNPDEYPGLDCIDRMEVVMQPGDVLYNPSWMWHSVQNEAPTIGVRCGFLYPKGMVMESMTLTFIRLFAARKPSLFEAMYYTLFATNLPERDKWLLTPKFFRQ